VSHPPRDSHAARTHTPTDERVQVLAMSLVVGSNETASSKSSARPARTMRPVRPTGEFFPAEPNGTSALGKQVLTPQTENDKENTSTEKPSFVHVVEDPTEPCSCGEAADRHQGQPQSGLA
jgi:hypothetical protein